MITIFSYGATQFIYEKVIKFEVNGIEGLTKAVFLLPSNFEWTELLEIKNKSPFKIRITLIYENIDGIEVYHNYNNQSIRKNHEIIVYLRLNKT